METDPGPGLWLARAADCCPARVALVYRDLELRYGDVYARVRALATTVMRAGAGPFCVVSSHAMRLTWASWLALHLGQPLLPLDPRRQTHSELLTGLGIRQAYLDKAVPVPDGVEGQDSRQLEAPSTPARSAPRPASSDAVQLLIATSGSTGIPRAAMLSAVSLEAAVLASRQRLGLEPGDVWLNCLPLCHIAGLSILLRCLQARATVILHDGFDARAVWLSLVHRKVTHLSLVPAMLYRLLAEAGQSRPPPGLRRVLVGGGPLSRHVFDAAMRTGWPVCPTYGLSENASQVATLCPAGSDWQPGDAGKPLPGVEVAIVDREGRPTGGPGLIRINGPMLMAGYANKAWRPGDGLCDAGFITGDLGYLDRRGHLHVTGRADDVFTTGGENVHPCEVEDRLRACPGIDDVAVVGKPDPRWGHLLVAFVVGRIEESALEVWCKTHLPNHLRPRRVIGVTKLPRNPMGKLERRRLADWAED
ncbi:MAG: fatty acid--CoA ligase family protein [Gammaproteobacteria bacterium]|nr:fatty acid--CoA ligase family protein [Gammaproteobacteria bacterium]